MERSCGKKQKAARTKRGRPKEEIKVPASEKRSPIQLGQGPETAEGVPRIAHTRSRERVPKDETKDLSNPRGQKNEAPNEGMDEGTQEELHHRNKTLGAPDTNLHA